MHLLLLLSLLLKVSRADDLTPMSAYVGENVTLLSGAHPSWDLLSITWSIWTNTTWIATYSEGKINVSRFYKYKGRLSLDRHTGNLHISNLSSADGLEYTVELYNSKNENKVNKIKLSIKQRLQKPNITTFQSSTKDECLFALRCSSSDSGVTLSWESHPQLQRYESTNNSIMGILKAAQNITCIARKNTDAASRTVSVKCDAPPLNPTAVPHPCPQIITKDPIFFVVGFFVAFLLSLVVFLRKRNCNCLNNNSSDV
ncbi:hypothetical protein NQD34_013500 [Periophthalmus magnuspinnatus]|nr:hypothetical protein NQD34_013500 [Periophthalmus magnuspinnatus]